MDFSTQVIKILDDLAQRFGLAIDWTSTNIVPYLQTLSEKIVRYNIFTSSVWTIIWFALFITGTIFTVHFVKKYKVLKSRGGFRSDRDAEDLYVFLSSLFTFFMFIFLIKCSTSLMQHLVFPEKTVFEFIKLYLK